MLKDNFRLLGCVAHLLCVAINTLMSSSNIETLSVAAFQAWLLFYVHIVRGESLGGSQALFSLAVL